MTLSIRNQSLHFFVGCLLATAVVFIPSNQAHAVGGLVPGTGTRIDYVGDTFEDTDWGFIHNFPKSSREQDEQLRSPTGKSTNGRWTEGPERGQPDHMKVVPNPAGALAGSDYGLLVRTLNSGIPGYRSNDLQQDDLIANCISRLGMSIPVRDMPSTVVRVYLPPADEWEDRTGPHFGFRISTSTTVTESVGFGRGFFSGSRMETKQEPYWPGLWIHFNSKTSRNVDEDSAFLAYRGDSRGRDIRCKEIPADQFGWWTFGISVTGDGQIHYYAKPGVGELTQADHITSQFPYSYHAETFRTFFFNVCNRNDGKTWSTPFIIDDPQLYVVNASQVMANVKRKQQREEAQQARREAMEAKRQAQREARQGRQQSSNTPSGHKRPNNISATLPKPAVALATDQPLPGEAANMTTAVATDTSARSTEEKTEVALRPILEGPKFVR